MESTWADWLHGGIATNPKGLPNWHTPIMRLVRQQTGPSKQDIVRGPVMKSLEYLYVEDSEDQDRQGG